MPASELAAMPAARESSTCADDAFECFVDEDHLVDEDRRGAERRITASSLAGNRHWSWRAAAVSFETKRNKYTRGKLWDSRFF
jgi:hypothetical protein